MCLKQFALSLLLLGIFLAPLNAAPASNEPDLQVTADAADHNFPPNAPVRFQVAAVNDGQDPLTGTLELSVADYPAGPVRGQAQAALNGAPVPLTVGPFPTGFYTARFRLLRDGQVLKEKNAVFCVDAASFRAKPNPPKDLDAFWNQTLGEMRKQPLDAHLIPVDKVSTEKFTAYKVDFVSVDGIRVYGWYLAPKSPGRHAAMLEVPSAGVKATNPPVGWANMGFAALSIGVFGLPVDLPSYTPRRYNGEGVESRENYIFRKIYAHAVRAVDFLATCPEVDPERIGITGSSQGGCLSLSTAALDPRIKLIVANVPAHCHLDWTVDRDFGWGPHKNDAPGGDMAALHRVTSYFDNANLATRIHCPVLLSAGMLDRTCPPDGIAALFNSIPAANKKLIFFPWMGHEVDPAFYVEGAKWMREILAPDRKG